MEIKIPRRMCVCTTNFCSCACNLQTRYENVTGDIMLSSGVIAYLGSFTSGYACSVHHPLHSH